MLVYVDLHRKIRPDLFVSKHLEDIDSQLTLAFAKAIKQNTNAESDKRSSIKDRSKLSILTPQVRSNTKWHIPLLPNGSELQKNKKSIVLNHACAFDSLLSVYGALYIDNPTMRNKIDLSSSKFAIFIRPLIHKKFEPKMEFARYQFLKDVFPDKKAIKERGDLILFDCDVAIAGLFESIYGTSTDIMSSRRRTQKCSTCGYKDATEHPFVNHTGQFDFKNVQKSLVPERTRVCDTCTRKTMTIEDQFHEIIVIDCESFDGKNEFTTINDIQKQIKLNEVDYELVAAIEYDASIKHFIPHIKRITNDWETYDDCTTMKADTDVNEEMFIFMLFYKKKTNGV